MHVPRPLYGVSRGALVVGLLFPALLLALFFGLGRGAALAVAGPVERSQVEGRANSAAETVLALASEPSLLLAIQGQPLTIPFTVTNQGEVAAAEIQYSFELPAGLDAVTVSASVAGSAETGQGEIVQMETEAGNALMVVSWPEVPAGASATVQIVAEVGADLANGSVLQGAAALLSSNAAYTYTALFIGLPPAVAPDFWW
jgi:uncharacterized repeat protein (TIGR01451 family)